MTIEDLAATYPLADSPETRKAVRERLAEDDVRIVVLDDDPTGVQTIHDCLLFTKWDSDSIRSGLTGENRMFYILTNSRSLGPDATARIYRGIAETIRSLTAHRTGRTIVISRSDSTLRGHFDVETRALREILIPAGRMRLPLPFIPVMFEAGRYTYHGEHYVNTPSGMVKASETEFAQDREFGYSTSYIPAYISEKTGGAVSADAVASIGIEDMRSLDEGGLERRILSEAGKPFLSIDALSYADLEKFSLAYLRVLSVTGTATAVCRSSSSFPRALSGQEPIPLLRGGALRPASARRAPGIVFVGSHVAKTSRQLEVLLERADTVGIEIMPDQIHSGTWREDDCMARIADAMSLGKVPAVFTSRKGVFLDDPEENLALSRKISSALVSIASNLPAEPGFIISKGGITSHDLLTRAMKVSSANVSGAILPGVPVLMVGKNRTVPFVIFPGNVGDETSLSEAIDLLA